MPVPSQDLNFQRDIWWSFSCSVNSVKMSVCYSVSRHFQQYFSYIVAVVKIIGDCLFCWYWWNWWPSLFKLSFHNFLVFFGIIKPRNLVWHKNICNKRGYEWVSKPRIQMSMKILLLVYPRKIYNNENKWNHSISYYHHSHTGDYGAIRAITTYIIIALNL